MGIPLPNLKKPVIKFGKNGSTGIKSIDGSQIAGGLDTVGNQAGPSIKATLKRDAKTVFGYIKEPFVYAWEESGIKDKIVNAWEDNIKEPFGLTADGVTDSFGKAVDNLDVPFLSKKDVENGVDLEKFKNMKELLDIDGLNPQDYIPGNFDAKSMAEKQGLDMSYFSKPSLKEVSIKDLTSGNFKGLSIDNLPKKADFVSDTMNNINSRASTFNSGVKSANSLFDLDNAFDTSNVMKAFEDEKSESGKMFNNPFHNEFDFKNLVDPEQMSYFEALESGQGSDFFKVADRSKVEAYAIQPDIDKIPVESFDSSMYAINFPKIGHVQSKAPNVDSDDNFGELVEYDIWDYGTEDIQSTMMKQLKSFDDLSKFDPFTKFGQMDVLNTDSIDKGIIYANEGANLMGKDAQNLHKIFDKNSNPITSDKYFDLNKVLKVETIDMKSITNKVVSFLKIW